MKDKFPILLLLLLTLLTLWSASNPYEWQVWWTEMASVLILVGLLVVTYRQFRFSNTSYLLMFVWSAMQVIGAHYTFELVPFDTISRIFCFERNHYDRVAHFAVGMGGMAAAELFWRCKLVNSVHIASIFSIIFIIALAGIWELAEWIYAEIDGGDAGQAFLGAQGDVWDAHKDMLMDTIGAIFAAILFYAQNKQREGSPSSEE